MISLDPCELDPDADELLTVTEAAARVDVPEQTVRTWIRRDLLPATRWGGRLMVAVSHVSDLEHDRRKSTGPGRPRVAR